MGYATSMLREFADYLRDAGRWGLAFLSGGIVFLVLAVVTYMNNGRVPGLVLATIGVLALVSGQFTAYRNKTLRSRLRILGGNQPEFEKHHYVPATLIVNGEEGGQTSSDREEKLLRVENLASVVAAECRVEITALEPPDQGVLPIQLEWFGSDGLSRDLAPAGFAYVILPSNLDSPDLGHGGPTEQSRIITVVAWAKDTSRVESRFRLSWKGQTRAWLPSVTKLPEGLPPVRLTRWSALGSVELACW